jgi:hypothetical protein
MPTYKKRINITLSDQIDSALNLLAKRDGVPIATKAVELLNSALEVDEDEVFNSIAEKRDIKNTTFASHQDTWL